MYAPWSVLSFLNAPKRGLRNYWYESAGMPSLIMNYLEKHSLEKPEFFARPQNVALPDLSNSNNLETMNPVVFLFQSGYLSIKECSGEDVILGYPNREVEASMARLYVDRMVGGKTFISMGVGSIKQLLAKGDPDEAVEAFNKIFLHIPYDRYPVTSESSCRMGIQLLLIGAGIYSYLEKHNAYGRSDLEFDAGDFHWVMEFKYLQTKKEDTKNNAKRGRKKNSGEKRKSEKEILPKREKKSPDILLVEALTQIKEKRYGEGPDIGNKKLLRVGLVFDGEKREFVRHGVIS